MPEGPADLESQRQVLLEKLYDKTGGSRQPVTVSDLASINLSGAEATAVVAYLRDAKLVESNGLGDDIQLTHLGVVEVEKNRAEKIFGMDANSWVRIDSDFLRAYAGARSLDDALAYIDGRRPHWDDCVPGAAPRRSVARRILGEFLADSAGGTTRPRIWAILGATGEGKSTALMQAAVDVALKNDTHVVLWRKPNGQLSPAQIARLPKGYSYLIASDDGEQIAAEILESIQLSGRADVHYCVAATTTEWQRVGGGVLPWRSYANYRVEHLRGLESGDAELIVREWEKYGSSGLRELSKESDTAARAAALVEATKKESSMLEGAFFGGMLRVRYGEYLKDHIRDLVRKLVARKKQDRVPYPQVYMLIAGAHSAGLLLTPEIVSVAAGLDLKNIRSAAIDPLSDEAVVTVAGGHVFTRHRMIATASVELAEDSGMSLSELFVGLVKAALVVGKHKYVEGYDQYVNLPRFFEKSRLDIAIAVAEAVYAEAPGYLANVHNLARVLLLADRCEASSKIYRKVSPNLRAMNDPEEHARSLRRVYYFEWGHSEYKLGNIAASTWLKAASIADLESEAGLHFCRLEEMGQDHIERALTSIAANLLVLYEKFGKQECLEAANAVITLTRRLSLTPSGRRVLRSIEDRVEKFSFDNLSLSAAKMLFREGVRIAFESRESELGAVPPGNELKYTQLFDLVGA